MPRARQPGQLLAGVISSIETWSPLLIQVSEGRGMATSAQTRGPGSNGGSLGRASMPVRLIKEQTLTMGILRSDTHSSVSSLNLSPQLVAL